MNLARQLARAVMGRRLPPTSGSLAAPGLDGEVLVRRDRWGIPHIGASSERDAWTGLGFCHAQDRAFQLESIRRLASGTLSELIGVRGLAADRLVRRLGFVRCARKQLSVLGPGEMATIEAYCEGIGIGLLSGGGKRAHEFTLTRSDPLPWEPIDVLATAKLISFGMSANWDAEFARFRVLTEDGHEALAAIDPDYAAWHPAGAVPGTPAGPQLDRLSGEMAALIDALGLSAGSNAWAISPARTATGRPILANDPHLPPRLPSTWYLAHLDCGEWRMAGATFVGVPIVAAGHNGSVAWGVTLGLADTSDVSVAPAGQDPSDWGAVEIIREEIRVRGRSSIVEDVAVTARGPEISSPGDGTGHSFFLRATWMEPRPIGGLLRAPRAGNCHELRQAFSDWPLMSLNVVFADVDGSIGWQMAGDAPVRRSGSGLLPAPAADPAYDWEPDPVPFEDMPGSSDPGCGFVVSANHRPLPEGTGPFLGVDWADGLRASRVAERLAASSSWDVADTARLQTDLESVQWREVMEEILAIRPRTEHAVQALRLLDDWDGRVGPDSAAAAVFEVLMARIDRLSVDSAAPRAGRYSLGADVSGLGVPNLLAFRRAGRLTRILRERGGDDGAGWQDLLSAALDDAAAKLVWAGGSGPRGWEWGRVRPLVLRHPLSRIPGIGRILDVGPLRTGGDTNTVWQAAVDPLDPLAAPLVIPSLRCVVDVGDFGRSTFSLAGGQSGNPFSPHYADLVPLWARGEGVSIAWSMEEVDRATVSTLRLLP